MITAIEGDRITVDAPVMCAIETRWGGGEVAAYDDRQRVKGSGVENLRGISEFNGRRRTRRTRIRWWRSTTRRIAG